MLKHKIHNVIVMVNFEKRIDLEKLAIDRIVVNESEQFPGGILRIVEPYKATVLVFASGKAIFIGLKSTSQIAPITRRIANMIKDQN